ncbi:hypothetical protein BC831DRAFT_448164 [Entophlyctis helioformis]|nr:hypothetical protein BC831DRAFT_448164 [Entophlyctis helioformis]
MSIVIPFDRPRFDQPEEYLAAVLCCISIPLMVYNTYDTGKAFIKARSYLTGNFMALSIICIIYQIAMTTCTFFYTHLNLIIVRVVLFFIATYINQVVNTYFILDIFSRSKLLWKWFPYVFFAIMNVLFWSLYTPRLFYYSLFISPTQNNWAAIWYRNTANPYTIIGNSATELIACYAVFTLFWNFNKMGKRESKGTKSAASASSGGAGDQASSGNPIVNFYRKLNPSQIAVFRLAFYLAIYMCHIPVMLIYSQAADAAMRPPPSAGWRKGQALICVAATLSVIFTVFIWWTMKGLKDLRFGGSSQATKQQLNSKASATGSSGGAH